MTFPLRPTLALVAFVILNLALSANLAVYSLHNFLVTMIPYVIGLAAALSSDCVLRLGSRRLTGGGLMLAACALTLTIGSVPVPINFPDNWSTFEAMTPVGRNGYLLVLAILFFGWRELISLGRPQFRAVIPLLLVCVLLSGFALRAMAIKTSPEPIVDVYNLQRDSADFILAGKNPYANDYHSPYHTERAREWGLYYPDHPLRVPGYPPLTYLLCVVPRIFDGDVRWAHASLDLIAGLCLFIIGWRRGRPFAGLVAAATYLHLPRAAYIIEIAWTEPMVNGLLGLGFVLVDLRGPARFWGHLFFGLGLTIKQYGATMLIPHAWAYRSRWRLVFAGVAAGVAVMLPWLAWSPPDFVDIVVFQHMTKAPGFHSITIISACADLADRYPAPAALWLICGPLLLLIAYRSPPAGPASALAVGTALMTYVVFSPVGFMNYFLPTQYLWLMSAMVMAFPDDAERPQ